MIGVVLFYHLNTMCTVTNLKNLIWVPMVYPIIMARKDVAFKIRIEEKLRQEFLEVCRSEDLTAAQVVRRFMREYIDQHRGAMQQSLFASHIQQD
jgi:uncharacterized protein YnzC (UPF0291/DUF896 family)